MDTSKQILIKFGCMAFGAILAVFIMEVGLRLIGFNSSLEMFDQYEFDEILGWKTKTSFEAYRPRRHSGHFSYYNPDGFPVLENDWERPTDRSAPSIAFIGDSFTEGAYLPYKYTFPNLVDEKIPDRRVINLGVGGYAPDQYLLNARRHLGNFNITSVVVMFFGYNDVPGVFSDIYNGYAKPVFGADLDQPINLPLAKMRGNTEDTLTRRIANRSMIFRFAKPGLVKYILKPIGLENQSAWNPRRYSGANILEENSARKALRLIKQIELEFPVNRFVVYYVPKYEETIDGGAIKHNIGVYLNLCGELNLECYTPEKLLKETPDTAVLYIPLDGHFSRTGSSRIADGIYDILDTQVAGGQ